VILEFLRKVLSPKKSSELSLDELKLQLDKAVSIFENEGMFENLQWLLDEGAYLSANFMSDEVIEFSSKKNLYEFKFNGFYFKVGCENFQSFTFPDGKPWDSATFFIECDMIRVFEGNVHVYRDEYSKKLSLDKTAKILKLKKEWIRTLKRFFDLAKRAVEKHKEDYKNKQDAIKAAELSKNIDLGDY
jgi:hypothetical protein